MSVAYTPIGFVNLIPLETDHVPTDDSGQDNDVAIDQPNGIIYVKISGVWTQVWPEVIT